MMRRFGKLIMLTVPKSPRYRAKCQCDCGGEIETYYYDLLYGRTKSCGCIRRKMASTRAKKMGDKNGGKNKVNIKGKKFYRLLALRPTGKRDIRRVVWEWLCDCGNVFYKPISPVKNGVTKSCGCLNAEKSRENIKRAHEICRGENHHGWNGGSSFEPYPLQWTRRFKDSIRLRDGLRCQMCGGHQDSVKLSVHHIDYDKNNLTRLNLISLCRSCHGKTHYNREYWEVYFGNQIACN